ncbi:hypothetical protein VF21_03474 [Pseudogymnoascus sp. 05NY08]|nr:hypothetical protein VF21_03474 [Pseudogymnoascus sp. 05NY08]
MPLQNFHSLTVEDMLEFPYEFEQMRIPFLEPTSRIPKLEEFSLIQGRSKQIPSRDFITFQPPKDIRHTLCSPPIPIVADQILSRSLKFSCPACPRKSRKLMPAAEAATR